MPRPKCTPSPVVCTTCGETFYRIPSVAKRRKFCSKKCFGLKNLGTRQLPLEEKFWKSVKKTDACWLWQRTLNNGGYGMMRYGQATLFAHRLSYELHYGPIPEGLCTLHRCDVRNCIRPDHLFLGTQTDNNADKVAKGRQLKGESHGGCKLTDAQVLEIRRLSAEGLKGITIAAQFSITPTQASKIIRRIMWKHLP